MSDFAQYPFEELQAVGRSLTAIAEQISGQSKLAFEVEGLTADQARIAEALGHFRSEWQASLNKLGENIGSFGDMSTQIGTMSGQFDAELATMLRPGGAPVSVHSGRGPQ